MIASRSSLLAVAAFAGLVVLSPTRAHAQWWRSAPVDFEACADTAEKAKTKEDKTAALAECNAKFAGRRKPGGGYTYYDFMQDRTFDIAGPNPTPEEQKHIDQQYTAYLENQRRNSIAAAFTAKQTSAAGIAARRAAGVAANGDREDTGAGGKPGQAGRAHQGLQLRQERVLLRMAAAFAKHRRFEEAVQLTAEQGEAGLTSSSRRTLATTTTQLNPRSVDRRPLCPARRYGPYARPVHRPALMPPAAPAAARHSPATASAVGGAAWAGISQSQPTKAATARGATRVRFIPLSR